MRKCPAQHLRFHFKVKVTFRWSHVNSCLCDDHKTYWGKFLKKYVPSMTQIASSRVKDITGGQLPSVRGLRGHLLNTVTFLVFTLYACWMRNIWWAILSYVFAFRYLFLCFRCISVIQRLNVRALRRKNNSVIYEVPPYGKILTQC